MIIWNFMEELWSKYQIAIKNGQQPIFLLHNFDFIRLFENYLPLVGVQHSGADNVILQALHDYEQKNYFKFKGALVTLTDNGLEQCEKSNHDWG
jgi:hypothetical protein